MSKTYLDRAAIITVSRRMVIFQSHYTYNMLKRMCTFGIKYVPADLCRWHVGTIWADIMVEDWPIREGDILTCVEGISWQLMLTFQPVCAHWGIGPSGRATGGHCRNGMGWHQCSGSAHQGGTQVDMCRRYQLTVDAYAPASMFTLRHRPIQEGHRRTW